MQSAWDISIPVLSISTQPWNTFKYPDIGWCFFRYAILFPMRVIIFVLSIITLMSVFLLVDTFVPETWRCKVSVRRRLGQALASTGIMLSNGIIKWVLATSTGVETYDEIIKLIFLCTWIVLFEVAGGNIYTLKTSIIVWLLKCKLKH